MKYSISGLNFALELTMNVDTAYLLLHDTGVDLTHIASSVTLFHLADVQLPRTVIVVRHADP
jgi:hypothetical protein